MELTEKEKKILLLSLGYYLDELKQQQKEFEKFIEPHKKVDAITKQNMDYIEARKREAEQIMNKLK